MGSTLLPGLGQAAQSIVTPPASLHSSLLQSALRPAKQAEIQRPSENQLPPLLWILAITFQLKNTGNFFSSVTAFYDAQYSGQRPIVGAGHHFIVYASPFAKQDEVPEHFQSTGAEVYCIKSPNFSTNAEEDGFQREYYHTVLQELRVLSNPALINNENIITLLGLDFQEDYDDYKLAWPVLLTEYAAFGTLDTFQEDLGRFNPELARTLLLDVALGIQSLHDCNIVHGDVKSENVLICGHPTRRMKYVAKISDFGLAVVNPSHEKEHYLPGCTFLWCAPEAGSNLSVKGMQLTDVYSFGLTVWRVVLNSENPFSLFMPNGTDPGLITRMKQDPSFPATVIQTLERPNPLTSSMPFTRIVIATTLSLDPTTRDLGQAIRALGGPDKNVMNTQGPTSSPSSTQGSDETLAILQTLGEAHPEGYTQALQRPSLVYSLYRDLTSLINSNSEMNSWAAMLYFALLSVPSNTLADKSSENVRQLLFKLCSLGSQSHQAIASIYCKIHHMEIDQAFDVSWLEEATWNGSYFALKTLSEDYPEHFQAWKSTIEANAVSSCTECEEDYQLLLVTYARTGNWEKCNSLLDAGVSASPDWDEPGALHFLAMHHDPQVPTIALRLIEAGAALDHWEGDTSEDVAILGKYSGTPLHWAVCHRNIPLVRVLVEKDPFPEEENAKRAVLLASAMYYYDVLEILKDWISTRSPKIISNEFISELARYAVLQNLYYVARLLRHGDKTSIAMSQTFELLFQMYDHPSSAAAVIVDLLKAAVLNNDADIFRYLVNRFDLTSSNQLTAEDIDAVFIATVSSNYLEIFDTMYESGLVTLDQRFTPEKFTGLQICLISRQRSPVYVQRYIQWGCPVDELGDGKLAEFTCFALAVQCGIYEIANILLSYGADKDAATGWLGGSTPTMKLLHTWPDIPISRVRYLLEEIPRQGFGHVSFIGNPAVEQNLLYAFSMAVWSHYKGSYRFPGTMKYVLSMLTDKSLLNKPDRSHCTALNLACRSGNLEVVRTLLEAGADPNTGMGIAPLNAAIDWCNKWRTKEMQAAKGGEFGEKRHATRVRIRAEELIQLLRVNGARERSYAEEIGNTMNLVASGGFRLPTAEYLLETLSYVVDRSSAVHQGSLRAHPTESKHFRAHKGNATKAQLTMRSFGRHIDEAMGAGNEAPHTAKKNLPPPALVPRYQRHSCYPWVTCPYAGGHPPPCHPSTSYFTHQPHGQNTTQIPQYTPPQSQPTQRWPSHAATQLSPTLPLRPQQLPFRPINSQPPSPPSSSTMHNNHTLPGLPVLLSSQPRPLSSPTTLPPRPQQLAFRSINPQPPSPPSSSTTSNDHTLSGLTIAPSSQTNPRPPPQDNNPFRQYMRKPTSAQSPPLASPSLAHNATLLDLPIALNSQPYPTPPPSVPTTNTNPFRRPPPPPPTPPSPPPLLSKRTTELLLPRLTAAIAALRDAAAGSDDLYDDRTPTPNPLEFKEKLVRLLQREFEQPVELLYRASGLEEVIDFAIIDGAVIDAVANAVGRKGMEGVELLPRLVDGGWGLAVDVRWDGDGEKGREVEEVVYVY